MDIASWLSDLGLSRHLSAFQNNEIGMDILSDLTEADFAGLGIPLGDRKRIMRGIAALDTSETPDAVPTRPDPGAASEAERRHLTVMFVDLVESTRIASELDPEEMRDLIRAFQNAVAGEVSRFDGYVAKFMGDGVLCYFGFPTANEYDAERAVRAGKAIIASVSRLDTAHGERARVRVGIATGIVVVGEVIGDAEARERDVVGETPNIAARLQSVAQPDEIVIAEATKQLVDTVFRTSPVDLPALKGISDSLRAFVVGSELDASDRNMMRGAGRNTELVGRDAELNRLMQAWRDVSRSGTRSVLLTGDAGIGKSRMLQAFRDRLGLAEAMQTVLHCSPFHSQTALHPIIQNIEKDAGIATGEQEDLTLSKLQILVSARFGRTRDAAAIFANLLGLSFANRFGRLESAPQQLRTRTLDLLVRYLVGKENGNPRLIVVEDVHWIDQTSIEALVACTSAEEARNTLFLFAGRARHVPEPVTAAVDETIRLGRLDRAAVLRMVRELTGGKAFPAELAEEIVRKTDGVPLFVQELTKTIIESGTVEDSEAGYLLHSPVSGLSIPASLHDSLMARLDRLHFAKRTAQTAACIGRNFDIDLLSDVATEGKAIIANALDELVAAELVDRPDSTGKTFSFRHALVRDTAYESLLKSQRRSIHARVADRLDDRSAPPETLAYHHEHAGSPLPAAACLLQAGQNALRICAATEAISRFQKGADLLGTLQPDKNTNLLRMRLYGMLGTGYMLSKSWGAHEVETAYSHALELVDETEDLNERIWIIWGAWVYRQVHGQVRASRTEARRAMRIAQESGDRDALLVAHVIMLQVGFYEGRWRDALAHGSEIERLYDAERHEKLRDSYSLDLLLVWYVHGSQACWMLGEFEQAAAMRAKAEVLSDRIDHAHSRAWVVVWGANLDLLRGEFDTILRHVPPAIQLAETHGFDYVARLGHLILAAAQTETGFEPAETHGTDDPIGHFQETGAGITIPYFLTLKARALFRAGEISAARIMCENALGLIEERGEKWAEPLARKTLGDILASDEIGDTTGAAAAYAQAIKSAAAASALVWQAQAELALCHLLETGVEPSTELPSGVSPSATLARLTDAGGADDPIVKRLISDLRSTCPDI